MLFSSIPFLYYFLPLVLAVYFLTPARFRNAVLLLASLIFYAWGEPKYVLLMLASILSGYGFGLLQERYRGQKGAKLVCGLSVAVSLSFLLYFKYADFFLENFNAATGLGVPLLRIALSISTAYEVMHEPGFPTLRVGSRMVVPKEKFIQWAEEQSGGAK